ncbi:MAG: GNAT family N-acetyltransferase [Nanoarchaeota archaeon]|nr:GNAT family N-acetyltransferase [Nanoarchaeota archaeon]
MENKGKIKIVQAREGDISLILVFIKALAEYEKLSDQVVATEETLKECLFRKKYAECVLAYVDDTPAGFALFFHNFSTFLGKPGLYLEDLFVKPEFRGNGVGKALLRHLAKLAKERGCGRFEWWVLDWNTPSIEFYKKMGAVAMDEWTVFRITGPALDKLAR